MSRYARLVHCVVKHLLIVILFAPYSIFPQSLHPIQQRLLLAVLDGDRQAFRAAVRQGGDPIASHELPGFGTINPLYIAAARNDMPLTLEILEGINSIDESVVRLVAILARRDIARLLLERKAMSVSGQFVVLVAESAISGKTYATSLQERLTSFRNGIVHKDSALSSVIVTPPNSADRVNTARLMLNNGADVNATDTTGVTALTVALNADDYDLVRLLFDRGAKINIKPSKGVYKADYEFADDPRYLPLLMRTLLKTPILRYEGPLPQLVDKQLEAYENYRKQRPTRLHWSPVVLSKRSDGFTCQTGTALWEDEKRLLLEATRLEDGSKTTFSLSPGKGYGTHFSNCLASGPVSFSAQAKTTIPACDWKKGSIEVCFPVVSVRHDSLFPVVVEQNSAKESIGPGITKSFDRSLGPLHISIGPGGAQPVFGMQIDMNVGDSIKLHTDVSDRVRFNEYVRLLQLDRDIAENDSSSTPAMKTAITERRVRTLMLVKSNWHGHVRERLQSRLTDLLSLREISVRLRHLTLTSARLGSEALPKLLILVENAIRQPGMTDGELAALREIEHGLREVASKATDVDEASLMLRSGAIGLVELVVRDIQQLTLEMAQYLDDKSLYAAIASNENTRRAIGDKLGDLSIDIPNETLGERGRTIRSVLGRP